jgi:hypothetical protein
MELSTTANWLSVIGGIISVISVTMLGVSWLWKFNKYLRADIKQADERAIKGGDIVAELLNQATNPARRADIYAYIQFQCTEFEANHTRRLISSSVMSGLILAGVPFISFLRRILDSGPALWLLWLFIISYIMYVISFFAVLFQEHKLGRMEREWKTRARNILSGQAFRHILKT